MIKLARVDHRLIHGQVAFTWTKFLGIDCILIPSDTIASDPMRMNMLRMAKPQSVKLIIKPITECIQAINQGLTDKYQMMVLLESVEDAYKLFKGTEALRALNLGGTKSGEGKKQISKAVHLTPEEEDYLKALKEQQVEIFVQMVPEDEKQNY